MNVTGIYFSPTKTTKKIVETIGKTIHPSAKFYDMTTIKSRSNMLEIPVDDLMIVGVPVYAGRVPMIAVEYLKRLRNQNNVCVPIVVYGNRDYDDALLELSDVLEEKGYQPIAAGAFIGEHSYTASVAYDRPDEKDLEVCRKFAEHVLIKKTGQLVIKGNKPYRKIKNNHPIGPKIRDRCLKCGICSIHCPTGALTYSRNIHIDSSLCIKCHACVKICPVMAIDFDHQLDQSIQWLQEHAGVRKEPELFYKKT